MKPTCTHTRLSVPHTLNVRRGPFPSAEGSQEIIGVATVQVCLDCAYMTGTVSNGSLLRPVTVEFSSQPEPQSTIYDTMRRWRAWEVTAREALLGVPVQKSLLHRRQHS